MASSLSKKRPFWAAVVLLVLIVGALSSQPGRNLAADFLRSLRVQKVQAVNIDLTPFTDPNSNPALHQMVAQMISDKVAVTVDEADQPAADLAEASRLAGFQVKLLRARTDAPKMVVSGKHAVNMTIDLPRLREIAKASGRTDLNLPQSLDGASVAVQIPHSVHAQYGTCPEPTTAANAISDQVISTSPSTSQFADCVRLSEGPTPEVNVPQSLDVTKLAEIGLEVAGMTPAQADDFFHTVDWKSTLTLSVPRQLRSYQQVKVAGGQGTLLSMGGRRGPGYTLIWVKNGIAYSLTGFGESNQAVALADSLQ